MSQNTRQDKRAKVVNLVVRYKSATVDEFIENNSHDVSSGGIFVRSPTPFAPGTLLRFELRLAGETTVISGAGRVVWKREPTQASPERPAGMGLSFVKIDDGSRAIIDRLVGEKPEAGTLYNSEPAARAEAGPPSTQPAGTSARPPPVSALAPKASKPQIAVASASRPVSIRSKAAVAADDPSFPKPKPARAPAAPAADPLVTETPATAIRPSGPLGKPPPRLPGAAASAPRVAAVPARAALTKAVEEIAPVYASKNPPTEPDLVAVPSLLEDADAADEGGQDSTIMLPAHKVAGGMFPASLGDDDDDDSNDEPGAGGHRREATVIMPAADFMREALREAGSSFNEVSQNPLFANAGLQQQGPPSVQQAAVHPHAHPSSVSSAGMPAFMPTSSTSMAAYPPPPSSAAMPAFSQRAPTSSPSWGGVPQAAPEAWAPPEKKPQSRGAITVLLGVIAAMLVVIAVVMVGGGFYFFKSVGGTAATAKPGSTPSATPSVSSASTASSRPSATPANAALDTAPPATAASDVHDASAAVATKHDAGATNATPAATVVATPAPPPIKRQPYVAPQPKQPELPAWAR